MSSITSPTAPYTPYNNITEQIENLKLQNNYANRDNSIKSSNDDISNNENHDYEQLRRTYQITPNRPAPKPPASSNINYGTLNSQYSELDGVPFILNPKISNESYEVMTLSKTIFIYVHP